MWKGRRTDRYDVGKSRFPNFANAPESVTHESGLGRKIFPSCGNFNFPSSGSRFVPCGKADGQTDMT